MSSNLTSVTSGKTVPAMPSVFDYQDYRQYLKDVIRIRRMKTRGYSLKRMAETLGFSSHAGLAMVLNGQRELRPPYLDRCLQNLRLPVNERLYFEAMVRAGQFTGTRRRSLLREVQLLSQTWDPPAVEKGIRLIDYGLVHQILCLNRTFMSVEEIREQFRYAISETKIRQILEFMLERNQIQESSGRYQVQTDVLLVKDETPSAPARQLHRDCLNLAVQALDDPLDRREFQTFIFTVDSKRIEEMKMKIKEMVRGVISEFEAEHDADTALQLHFNMFEIVKHRQAAEAGKVQK